MKGTAAVSMFVTVRYGDDQSRIFNINCRNEALLYHIKKRCKMNRDEVIELSDEHGSVKNLRQNLHEYGSDYLKQRETLILLRVDTCMMEPEEDTDSFTDRTVFIPMLRHMSDNKEFIDVLNPKETRRGSRISLLDEENRSKKSKGKDKKKDKDKEHDKIKEKEKDLKEKDKKVKPKK